MRVPTFPRTRVRVVACLQHALIKLDNTELSSPSLSIDDVLSELSSSKSGSPSPLVSSREFRESSVASSGTADDNNLDARDERHPSPFNKGSSSLGVSWIFFFLVSFLNAL